MKTNRSIRWMLTAWNMLLLAAVLGALLSLHYHLQRKALLSNFDDQMRDTVMLILPSVVRPSGGGPPGGPRSGPLSTSRPMDELEDLYLEFSTDPMPAAPLRQETTESEFEELLSGQGMYLVAWDPAGVLTHQFGDPPSLDPFDYPAQNKEGQYFLTRGNYRVMVDPHPSGAVIIAGKTLKGIRKKMETLRGYLILIGCFVFLLGYAGGRLMIRKALQPIRQISQTAEEIAAGEHSRRVELSDAPLELAGLAQTLNDTFDHLDTSLENQKRFTADASHELRTPIAVVIAQAQAALKRARSPEEYQTILRACLRAGQRMKSMADDLLELTRVSGDHQTLNKERQPVNGLLANAVAEANLLSPDHRVDLLPPKETVELEIDRERLHQVIMNLISNAIRHNPAGCPIHVSLSRADARAVIRVEDEGMGIPAEALPHIFDRFYRVDKARSRAQGGTGLGLAIARSLVEAHGGRIEAASPEGQGASFAIVLPLA